MDLIEFENSLLGKVEISSPPKRPGTPPPSRRNIARHKRELETFFKGGEVLLLPPFPSFPKEECLVERVKFIFFELAKTREQKLKIALEAGMMLLYSGVHFKDVKEIEAGKKLLQWWYHASMFYQKALCHFE
jgi:hypothetical protein